MQFDPNTPPFVYTRQLSERNIKLSESAITSIRTVLAMPKVTDSIKCELSAAIAFINSMVI